MFSTSEVLPPRCLSTSPGLIADPPGRFSADGMAAITFTRGLSSARARIVASAAAAPPMSAFIHSIWSAFLIDNPPESNVTPLPEMAMGTASPAPRYSSSINRGSFLLPDPTPRIPPKPPRSSCAFVHTFDRNPWSRAIRLAS